MSFAVIASTTSAKSKTRLLLCHPGMEYDLQKKIAQFVLQSRKIVARDGVGHLIGFLKRIGSNCPEILFEVPRATASRRAQRRHDLDQAGNIAGGLHRGPDLRWI